VAPVAIRRFLKVRRLAGGRIEDPLVPPLGVFEQLTGVQIAGDPKRNVEEQLTIVVAVGAAKVEVLGAGDWTGQRVRGRQRDAERLLREVLRLQGQESLEAVVEQNLPRSSVSEVDNRTISHRFTWNGPVLAFGALRIRYC